MEKIAGEPLNVSLLCLRLGRRSCGKLVRQPAKRFKRNCRLALGAFLGGYQL